MGIFSDWWSGRSANTGDVGHIDQQSRAATSSAGSGKPNVWRSVFDPGSNPNTKRIGSSYYDTVKDKTEPSTWEMILKGEEVRRKSFSDLDIDQKGYINQQDLQKAAGQQLDVARIFAEADANRDGRIDRKEFNAVLDKYFNNARGSS